MRKALLTSAGFENPRLKDIFLELVDKNPQDIHALFIPTAAIDADAIAMLPKCMDDLLKAGVLARNITVFDLHCSLPYDELQQYDAIYVCGGNTAYILQRINETQFHLPLKEFVDRGGVYVGVSAGSIITTENLPHNLGMMPCTLKVHVANGSPVGPVETSQCPEILLTNNQAILIRDGEYQVVE
ncbi:MAG: Type 1 glutamine amidotransferase-like domain-containing protein [Chloroflexota bacterium]|nr:Type 1 glutamine amidotransferase-like domain-containing protein [Chloroflexota bacterium]